MNSRASHRYQQCRQVAYGCRCLEWQNSPTKEQWSSALSSAKAFSPVRGRSQVWAVHGMWTADFYLLSQTLSAWVIYTFILYTCVILYLYVFYTHSQREYAPAAVANLTLLTQSYLCPFPLWEQLSSGSSGGDVNDDLFAAWVVRSVSKERHNLLYLETGGLGPSDRWRGPLNSTLSQPKPHWVFSAYLPAPPSSFLHALLHAPPPSTTPMFFFILTLTSTAAKFKFSCTWRSLESAPVITI